MHPPPTLLHNGREQPQRGHLYMLHSSTRASSFPRAALAQMAEMSGGRMWNTCACVAWLAMKTVVADAANCPPCRRSPPVKAQILAASHSSPSRSTHQRPLAQRVAFRDRHPNGHACAPHRSPMAECLDNVSTIFSNKARVWYSLSTLRRTSYSPCSKHGYGGAHSRGSAWTAFAY